MVDLSRRSFLGGILTVGAAAVITSSPIGRVLSAPPLWGDGVNDDTDALNALFANQPVNVMDEAVTVNRNADCVYLRGGVFRLSNTVFVRNIGVDIQNCLFNGDENFKGKYMLNIEKECSLAYCRFSLARGFHIDDRLLEWKAAINIPARFE